MKVVFLTCGPRGSGKTTYTHIINSYHPEIEIVSRDSYLIALYGKTVLPESNDSMYKLNVLMIERLKEIVLRSDRVILDYWNTLSKARRNTIKTLREIGFEKVICLYFITPLEKCDAWIQKKPDSDYISAESYKRSYESFHEKAKSVFEDSFDEVISINASYTPRKDSLQF